MVSFSVVSASFLHRVSNARLESVLSLYQSLKQAALVFELTKRKWWFCAAV